MGNAADNCTQVECQACDIPRDVMPAVLAVSGCFFTVIVVLGATALLCAFIGACCVLLKLCICQCMTDISAELKEACAGEYQPVPVVVNE